MWIVGAAGDGYVEVARGGDVLGWVFAGYVRTASPSSDPFCRVAAVSGIRLHALPSLEDVGVPLDESPSADTRVAIELDGDAEVMRLIHPGARRVHFVRRTDLRLAH